MRDFLTNPSPLILLAALSVILACVQVALDASHVQSDPAVSDAFRLVVGATVALLGARHVINDIDKGSSKP